MNRSRLVDHVANDAGLIRSDARRAVQSVIATVQAWPKHSQDVTLAGFVRFSLVKRACG